MEEYYNITPEEAESMLKDSEHNTVDEILEIFTNFRSDVKIVLEELKILFDAKIDKNVNFAIYFEKMDLVRVEILDKKPQEKVGIVIHTLGTLICSRFNKEEKVFRVLRLADEYQACIGKPGVYIYRDSWLDFSMLTEYSKELRDLQTKSENTFVKYNL